MGEFAPAREHLEQGIALYDRQTSLAHGALQDLGVDCRAYLASTLWHLGYPDQALRRINEALRQAHGLAHPFSIAVAHNWAACLHQHRREGQAAQQQAEATVSFSTEHGFPNWLLWGSSLRGWAVAEQGHREEGIDQMCQGLAAARAMGVEALRPYFLGMLAEAYGKGKQADKGLTLLTEALDIVDKNDERMWEAELYRLKGKLTLEQLLVASSKFQCVDLGPSTPEHQAEACFRKAMQIARRQGAKSLELRATMSLAWLLARQGRRDEARTMLTEIYNWFTEGFDTADLKEAKALLDELAP